MKLTEAKAKEIVQKVYDDLEIRHDKRYPLKAVYSENNKVFINFSHWLGGYHYNNPIGDDWFGEYSDFIITVNDETGEAVMISGTGGAGNRYLILENGKYKIGEHVFAKNKKK